MANFCFLFYLLFSLLLPVKPTADLFVSKQAKVKFQSNAPLELIKASSTKMTGIIDAEKKTFAFKISIISFEGFNSALQREHFNENYMETKKFPDAIFTGKIIEDINFKENGEHTIRAKGKLTIHGVEQERIIKSKLKISNGKLTMDTQFKVPLTDHNINIPKIVSQKIATEIEVIINAEFEAKK